MNIYIGLRTLKAKCTQHGFCGQTETSKMQGQFVFEVKLDGQYFPVKIRKTQIQWDHGLAERGPCNLV